MDFSAVILAGGASRRMGRDKAWIELKGESLLSRAVRTVRRAGASEILISGRRGGDYSAVDCPVLLDAKLGRGPLGGIERALDVASFPLLLVLAVDLPRMTATFLRKMLSRCEENIGVVPRLRDDLEPLVAVYPKQCHALVVAALRQNRWAARDFANAALRAGMVRPFEVAAKEQMCFANCNSPSDLPRAEPAEPRTER